MAKENWTTVSTTDLFHFRGKKLRKDNVRIASGKETEYIYLQHPGSVVIVPFLDDTLVLLLEQYRYPIRNMSIEFPMGGIDTGEDERQAAERELLEETGYTAQTIIHIGSLYPSNGMSDEKVDVFIARDLELKEGHVSSPEEMQTLSLRKHSFEEVLHLINTGVIKDGFTISACLLTQLYLQKKR
ncbi:MAG: NUDIX hydrolase [bacterium]|nr:NUDIX hydrolase [bacterium]